MSEHPEFVLKHRLVGAGVLIFFGALVVPWLLGPPDVSEQSSVPEIIEEQTASDSIPDYSDTEEQDEVPQELLESMIGETAASTAEEVYVSRITPLSQTQTRGNPPAVNSETDDKSSATANQTAQSITLDNVEPKPVPEASKNNSAPVTSQATVRTEVSPSDIKVGWVVQVGVFVDPSGASKVVADLTAKGFTPQTTIVDTNKGVKTGTRVWLGPFSTRVDAAKSKALLTEQTGERGFIRSYP